MPVTPAPETAPTDAVAGSDVDNADAAPVGPPPGVPPEDEMAGAGEKHGGNDVELMDRETEVAGLAPGMIVPAATGRRAGVIVEQGDGWSLEIWPGSTDVPPAGVVGSRGTP